MAIPDGFEDAVRAALVHADLPPEQMAELVPYMVRQPDLVAIQSVSPWEGMLAERITHASTFYRGSGGQDLPIRSMVNGHLHNACAAMKKRRLTGLDPFTILAMEAEITRRAAAEKESP